MDDTLGSYVAAFVAGLRQGGVQHAVISPGSRSTPLVMAFARSPIRVWTHVDERAAAFFALGMAKVGCQPVTLVCTSGTAAANYYPAVIEARHSDVPLVIATADRPPELRGVGAPQSIDQLGLYGSYPKWFHEMAVPSEGVNLRAYAQAMGLRATMVAVGDPPGPVHLNFPFREPLIPRFASASSISGGEAVSGRVSLRGRRSLAPDLVSVLLHGLETKSRGILVVGPSPTASAVDHLTALAKRLQYPLLADPLSGLRQGSHDRTLVIDGYDAFLRKHEHARSLVPDLIVRFGPMPSSKALTQALTRWADTPMVVVDDVERGRDPLHRRAITWVDADPAQLARDLEQGLRQKNFRRQPQGFVEAWLESNRVTRQVVDEWLGEDGEAITEGGVFSALAEVLPASTGLFVGNSMPIRDLDTFFPSGPIPIRIWANRGANGIDGVVSTALGASTIHAPMVLVVGDLSFYHDLGGLAAAKLHGLAITIVVIHNNGGGIFSLLPQADALDSWERLFRTPLGLDYQPLVHMYGGRFIRVGSRLQFVEAVREGLAGTGITVIEVPSASEANAERHRVLWARVASSVRPQATGL